MSKFRAEFIDLVNTLRTNPQAILAKIKQQMNENVSNDGILTQSDGIRIRLKDGKKAYELAIKALSSCSSVAPMKENKTLHQVSKDYLSKLETYEDMNEAPDDLFNTTHKKYGTFEGKLSSVSEFGGNSPLQVLINLLVEDGSDSKEYIKIFMDPKLKEIGLHFQAHKEYRFCTFIVLATKFKGDDNDSDNVVEQKITTEISNTYVDDDDVPKKKENISLRNKPNVHANAPQNEEEDDDTLEYFDENVKSVKKSTKIINKNGKKYKVSTITKVLIDGTVETQKETERV